MPFDELKQRALAALEERREAYHSAVATAVDEVRALLDSQKATNGAKGTRAAAELGTFASGRIDPERFESLFGEQEKLDGDAVKQIETALATLTELLDAGDDLYTAKVRPGGDLRDTVRDALARAGRAFGAGRTVERVRSGAEAVAYEDGFGPTLWNRAERTVAPPLVVELDGDDGVDDDHYAHAEDHAQLAWAAVFNELEVASCLVSHEAREYLRGALRLVVAELMAREALR